MKNKEKIAKLNDELRSQIVTNEWIKTNNVIVMSKEVSQYEPLQQNAIFTKVAEFKDFSEDNNPYGTRDFGAFDFNFTRMFWKIDYYDNKMENLSPDMSDPSKTKRVLTIMFAHEY